MMRLSNTILEPIGEALDEMSWEWLGDNAPALASAVREAVGRGGQAEDVRSYVMLQTERRELALRCEQGARHLIRQGYGLGKAKEL